MRLAHTLTYFAFLSAGAFQVTGAPLSEVTTLSSFGATDSVGWGQLGSAFDTVSSPFTATSANGLSAMGSGSTFERRDEGFGWIGVFAAGDELLWNQDSGNSITLSFSSPVAGAGAVVQGDTVGDFSVTLTAFSGLVDLGYFTVTGTNTFAEDGSAPFIGVLSSSADITSVVFSELDSSASNELALDTLQLTTAPEPVTASLAGLALFFLLANFRVARKRVRGMSASGKRA